MSLESATFIDDLDTANPASSDSKSQGDDHLRLIKLVLKNSIKRVSRAFYVPNTVAKSGNYSVLAADDNKTIVCDTTSAFTLTLPTLSASDAGWCCYVLKTTTDANPVWIAPPSGTIHGFTKVRRSVANALVKVLWTGSVFVVSRTFGVPIGALVPFDGTTLPQGCLWPDGTTFTAADYVELNSALGGNTKKDVRERMLVPWDNSAGVTRVTSAGSSIDGDTAGATGGAQNVTLDATMIPSHQHDAFINDPGHTHDVKHNDNITTPGGGAAFVNAITAAGATTSTGAAVSNTSGIHVKSSSGGSVDDKTGSVGGGLAHNNMPPAIVMPFVLIAE